jgi:hypothetical protein
VAVTSKFSLPASPLFVFDQFDRLSDEQIQDVYEALHCDDISAAGVLLAPFNFLVRLERPALQSLKADLAAHFGVQEVCDDEAVAFLHNQLLAQRDRRIEARGFRRGILMGLGAGAAILAGFIGSASNR